MARELPEQYKIHSLYLENDLDSDSAYDVVIDHSGYLWVGTDNGLKRYDGYQFTNFVPDPNAPGSLGSSITISLLVQRDGTFWAGGRTLNRFHPETETFSKYSVSDGGIIWAMLEAVDGNIWLGGEGFGLQVFDPDTETVVMELLNSGEWEENKPFITSITHDSDPLKLWVASDDALYRVHIQSGELEQFDLPWEFDFGTDGVKEVIVDESGLLWIATQKGLGVLNPETKETRVYEHDPNDPHSLSTNAIWSVYQDSLGQVWVGTDKNGVHKYRPETDDFLHIPASEKDESAFPPASIDDIYEDEQGSLWFSVRKYGVRRMSPHLEKFRNMRKREGNENSLNFDNVLCMLEDRQGAIWIATDGGGLDIYEPATNTFTHIVHDDKNPNSLSSDSVISLAEDAQGNIWVGTWNGGINIFDSDTKELKKIIKSENGEKNNALGNNNIFRMEPDADAGMWISVWRRGLQYYEFATEQFTSYPGMRSGDPYDIYNLSVNDVETSQEGVLWVGGYLGLERLDLNSHVSERVHTETLQVVTDLLVDGDALWVGSSTGLYRLNIVDLSISGFTKTEGLSDNYVTSIEKDTHDNLWVGTRSGLNRFNVKTGEIEKFDERDGLIDSQFNTFSHLKTRSGLMYFGGPKGISYFDPENLPRNTHKPKTILTEFELFQKDVNIDKSSFLTSHISYTKKIKLPYSARDLTFEFSALDFISPPKNRYKYKLDGLEDNWVEVDSSRRRVRYTNLDPGEYIFAVKGSNNDGVWDDLGGRVAISVLSPWWMTWWARIIFFLASICIVYFFVYWRLRVTHVQEKLLRMKVKEKTQELELAHQEMTLMNQGLEERVEERTKQLSIEVEERKSAEDKLFHMAFHDSLTGLRNRPWLLDELEKLISTFFDGEGEGFGLMFLDGDHFKQINDTYGHLVGDRLLVLAAQRLSVAISNNCHAIRLGGDEFTILVRDIASADSLFEIAKNIVSSFDRAFKIDNQELHFRVTVGMVLCDKTHTKPEFLLRDADIAMYRAKAKGRGTYQLFDAKMREQAQEMATLERDLMYAIVREEFYLVYQPIVDLDTGRLIGFEALLRWEHASKGNIPPDKFIPLAEENGSIVTIGVWALNEACKQLSSWNSSGEVSLSMAVNISSNQLKQLNFISCVDDILLETGVDPKNLKLEITESAIMDNTDTVANLLDTLRERGLEFAIDDFGTGYSSLRYLDTLPVQHLKIDRQFVSAISEDMPENDGTKEIVRATISLAHNLNLQVVAEGIETQTQYQYLKDLGCEFGQGYFISRPMKVGDACEFIAFQFGVNNVSEGGKHSFKHGQFTRVPPTSRLRDRRD